MVKVIDLYSMCKLFHTLPSELLKQDAETLAAFQTIHTAEQEAKR